MIDLDLNVFSTKFNDSLNQLILLAFNIPNLEKKPLQNVVRPQRGALSRVGLIIQVLFEFKVSSKFLYNKTFS